MKRIGIVIVGWNSRAYLIKCLSSIFNKLNVNEIEVAVVDNASRDGSLEMLRNSFPRVRAIDSGGNIGFAKANNIGFRAVDCRYVLFLNPDTELIDNSICAMADFLDENLSYGAVGPKMIYENGVVQPLGLQWFPNPWNEFIGMFLVSTSSMRYLKHILPYKDPLESGDVRKIYGGCILARKELLEKVEVFDERYFMYGEDVDLCLKINRTGYKIYYMAESCIIHHCGASSKKSASQFSVLMKCESICRFMEKHHGKVGQVCYRLIIFSGSLVRLFYLALMKCLETTKLIRDRDELTYSMDKYRAMIKWSLNRERPVILN